MKKLNALMVVVLFSFTTSISQASFYFGDDCPTDAKKAASIQELLDQTDYEAKTNLQKLLQLGPKPEGKKEAQAWRARLDYYSQKITTATALNSKLTAMAILNGLGDLGVCHVDDGQD